MVVHTSYQKIRSGLIEEHKIINLLSVLIVLGVALSVIYGWLFNKPTLIQIRPNFVPMQFNTALCFILSALMIHTLINKKMIRGYFVHRLFSTVLFSISFISLLQYMTGQNYGIDEFFIDHYILVKSTFPGRMSPNTATCFILVSCLSFTSLFNLIEKNLLIIKLILTSTIIAFSATSFLGYLLNIDVAFAWQTYTRMAVHTSFLFLVLSSTYFFHVVTRLRDRDYFNWLPIPATLILLVTFVIVAQFIKQNEAQTIKQTVLNDSEILKGKATIVFQEKIKALKRMAERINYTEQLDEERWLKDAKEYYYDFQYFKNFEVYLNNPPRRWSYPSRKQPINLDQRRVKEVMLFNTGNDMTSTISNIVTNKNNENIAYISTPIVDKNKLTGVQIVSTDTNQFFKQVFKDVDLDSFKIQVLENDIPFFQTNGTSIADNNETIKSFFIQTYTSEWNIAVTPTQSYVENLSSSTAELVLVFGAFFSALGGLLIYNYQNAELSKKEAQYSEKLKSSILANMSHEIRTPMNGIIGMVEVLSKELKNKQDLKKIELIKTSTMSLMKTINDILDLSKLDARKLELTEETFNIKDLIRDLVTLFSMEAAKRKSTISYSFTEGFPNWIKGDPYRLRQVLNNIISNASKFTQDGKISIELDYKIESHDLVTIDINVSDTGIGISKSEIPKLFEDYKQAENNIAKEYGGSGLGLSISKKIIDLLKGSISIESEIGEGTTVHIDFQCKLSKKPEVNNRIFVSHSNNSLNALIADDSPIQRKILKEYCKKLDIKAVVVNDGSHVLPLMEKKKFDLIILDYHMPQLDGMQTIKLVREKYKSQAPKIITLTGSIEISKHKEFKNLGADYVVSKPIDLEKLQEVIEECFPAKQLFNNKLKVESALFNNMITKDELLLRFDGDKQLLKESISMLLENITNMISNIENAIAQQDYESLRLNAHSYRSAIANFHIVPAIKYAELIEDAAKSKEINSITENLNKLKEITSFSQKRLKEVSIQLGN